MIIDSLKNAPQYYCNHPAFKKAFQFITEMQDFSQTNETEFQIAENIKGFTSEFKAETIQKENLKMECHKKNIDIQYCISGSEVFGWKNQENCSKVLEPYNKEKDVKFFTEDAAILFTLTPGQFVVFFPEDAHAPGMGNTEIKKLVLKISI